MTKSLLLSLPVLIMTGCADTSERYRDLQQLELPPVLPIEHTHSQAVVGVDDLKPKSSSLGDILFFKDDEVQPTLLLKTRPERAWEMLMVALKISNVQVLDKNRQENRIQLRFDADSPGQESTLLDLMFNNAYDEAEYTLTLKEEITGMRVLAALSKPDELEFGEDGSPELLRWLHKIIDEKIIHRDNYKPED